MKSLKTSTGPLTFQQLPLLFSNFTSLRLAAKYGGFYFIRAKSKFTDLLSEKGATETTPGDYVATFISAVSDFKEGGGGGFEKMFIGTVTGSMF